MSRTSFFILVGGILGLIVGTVAVAALLFGRTVFADRTATETPSPIVVETPTSGSGQPTATNTAEPGATTTTGPATVVPTLAATQPAATAVPATAAPAACTNIASLVADVTVPDNTQYEPNSGFSKIWRLKNMGTCTWTFSYQIVHAGGNLLNAASTVFPLDQTVAPGQTADIAIDMVSPETVGTYEGDWKLQSPEGKIFGLGVNGAPFFVKIVVTASPNTTIAGLVFQDWNENGVYDAGETLMGGREVRIFSGTACHVVSPMVASTVSGADGIYTFKGNFSGNYCVGLVGVDGLDDVVGIAISYGQVLNNINLQSPVPSGSISGFVWSDFCQLSNSGNVPEGNCVPDGFGSFHADGMIQPNEVNIPGVTVLIRLGSCLNNNNAAVSAVTDGNGRYTFVDLLPGTYCVSIDALANGNQQVLLPGMWTYPQTNVWYQELTLTQGAQAYSVNFGWDYQLK
ncbi:MAG: NBR1-Ig-like domain-containing protein [Candidatus Promineifilaceae bacterium]